MDMGIDELVLSVRSFNCLKRAGVDTVRDLMSFTDYADLMSVRNMGKKSLDEVKAKLLSLGLTAPWMMETSTNQTDSATTASQDRPLEGSNINDAPDRM